MSSQDERWRAYVAAYDVEVGEDAIQNELNAITLDMKHRMLYDRMGGGAEHRDPEAELAAQAAELREAAVFEAKEPLVIKAVVARQNLSVTPDELRAEAESLAQREHSTLEMVRRFFGDDYSGLAGDVLRRKAIDRVVGPDDVPTEEVSIVEGKKELRKRFKAIRDGIGADERARMDAEIAVRVEGMPEYLVAHVLLPYLSFGSEIDTYALIRDAWSRGKTVALPWCVPGERRMRWFKVDSFDGLVKSKFGVLEPVPDEEREVDPNADALTLAIVPGLTFDAEGYRMGYGGGFYDTFLDKFCGLSIGLCREAQFSPNGVEALDAHDLPVRYVVTEARIIEP